MEVARFEEPHHGRYQENYIKLNSKRLDVHMEFYADVFS